MFERSSPLFESSCCERRYLGHQLEVGQAMRTADVERFRQRLQEVQVPLLALGSVTRLPDLPVNPLETNVALDPAEVATQLSSGVDRNEQNKDEQNRSDQNQNCQHQSLVGVTVGHRGRRRRVARFARTSRRRTCCRRRSVGDVGHGQRAVVHRALNHFCHKMKRLKFFFRQNFDRD